MVDLSIHSVDIANLKPWVKNARTHTKTQIRQIVSSIEEFGFTNPVLIDGDNNILAGHCRVKAAELLGMKTVPCVRLDHMTAAQKRAYVIADNKLALNAGWDEVILADEFEALLEIDLEFDISLTGFSIAEIDTVIDLNTVGEPEDTREDVLPEDDSDLPDCHDGDIWQLGPHRLTCGNALEPDIVDALMDGDKARMVLTDPPYNVPVDGHICGSGSIKHEEFAFASGEMSQEQFTDFLKTAFNNMAAHSVDGSIHYICMDWRHMSEILAAGNDVYSEFKNLIVWVKNNGGMGTFYRSRHELIFIFKHGTAPHINTFELGQHGRYRTNVWEYQGMNSFTSDRMEKLALHPTVKPVQMMADAIKDVSGRKDIVLDLFAGSGSTLIAAHKTGRRAYVCEIDPVYCGRIIRRWEAYANDKAVCISRGSNDIQPLSEAG